MLPCIAAFAVPTVSRISRLRPRLLFQHGHACCTQLDPIDVECFMRVPDQPGLGAGPMLLTKDGERRAWRHYSGPQRGPLYWPVCPLGDTGGSASRASRRGGAD